jgi:hypothetical protein
LQGIGSADLKIGECVDGMVAYNSPMVEDFLKLRGLAALMCG